MALHSTLVAAFSSLPTSVILQSRIRIQHLSSRLGAENESPKSKYPVVPVGRSTTQHSRHSSSISPLRHGSSRSMRTTQLKYQRNMKFRQKDRMVSNLTPLRADCCAPAMQASCSASMPHQVASSVMCVSAAPPTLFFSIHDRDTFMSPSA